MTFDPGILEPSQIRGKYRSNLQVLTGCPGNRGEFIHNLLLTISSLHDKTNWLDLPTDVWFFRKISILG